MADLGGLISGDEDFEESGGSSSKWHTTKLKMGSNGDFKGLDLGLNLLAGYQINSKLSVNLGYGLGLVNISGGGGQLKNRVLSLSARYMLKQ